MKTMYMMRGLPASGKSTAAKQMLDTLPGRNMKIINKDALRLMLDDGRWSRDNEKFVLAVRDLIIEKALVTGNHVIVDDTNLAKKHEDRLRQLAKQFGAAFEIQDFTHVTVDECIERDRKRPNYVGEKVIRDMNRQFLEVKPPTIEFDPSLPDCVVFDVDGTLAKMVGRGPFEWDKVFTDEVNEHVAFVLKQIDAARMYLDPEKRIFFVSGRDECCRTKTETWISTHLFAGFSPFVLWMRPAGDSRDDRIIKREIYEREIKGKYNVRVWFDDRPKVIREMRSLGLPVIDCGEGVEF